MPFDLRSGAVKRTSPGSGKPATVHTAIVGDVAEMWSKLRWDADVFRELQIAHPAEPEPLGYAALNVCIAASSLRDWVKVAIKRTQGRREGPDGLSLDEEIWRAVPLQRMCEGIANTAKHAVHSEDRWSGEARLDWRENDEDAPDSFVLRYLEGEHRSADVYALAANMFHDLLDQWAQYLTTQCLISADQRTPAWEQRKWARIFPPIED